MATICKTIFIFIVSQLFLFSSISSAELIIDTNYQLISSKRVGRTSFDYTYKVNIINNGFNVQDVIATVISDSPNTTIMDGNVSFGEILDGETISGEDTFTFRQNRKYAFDPSTLSWEIQFELVANVILPEGGEIQGENNIVLIVPAGATDEPVTVTMKTFQEGELGAPAPPNTSFLGGVNLDIGDTQLKDNADISIPAPVGVPDGAEVYLAKVVEYAGQTLFQMVDTAIVQNGIITSQDPGFPGVVDSGKYAFLLAPNAGWVNGKVRKLGEAVSGAVVTLSGGSWIDTTDSLGDFNIPAWLGNYVVVAFDPVTGEHGEKQGYLPFLGAAVSTNVDIEESTGVVEDSIQNGDFEVDDLSAWGLSGAGSIIPSFGDIIPFDGNTMASINTGSGAIGDASSFLEQSFKVPLNAKLLTIYYNFVSEEYPEWVGSEFNDVFNASLHTSDGSVELAFESVNSANFHPAPGLDSWGETGWLKATVDVSQWAGLTNTLTFSVHDVGDTSVDTVVLIDGIKFSEDDHSNSPNVSATTILPNSYLKGEIETLGDYDWFKFQAKAGEHYTIKTIFGNGVPINADTSIILSDGNSSIIGDNNSGLSLLSQIEWTSDSSDTFYIGVMGNKSYTGKYLLSIQTHKFIYLGIIGAAQKTDILDVIDGDYQDIIPGSDFNYFVPETWVSYFFEFFGVDADLGSNISNTDLNINAMGNNWSGIQAIGLKLSKYNTTGKYRIASSGGTLYHKEFIDVYFKQGDQVVLVGHSAGGGDVQTLGYSLDDLDVKVQFSAQIDSIEAGPDAKISNNVSYAVNYYQNEAESCFSTIGIPFNGEDNIYTDNTSLTTIIGNFHVINPVGPSDPLTECSNPHQNMDNDPRVWLGDKNSDYKGILDYIYEYSFINK